MMGLRTRLLASAMAVALLPFIPSSAPAQQQADAAVSALLDQANYWRLQNQPQQAMRALERLLAADPRNVEGLAAAAAASAEAGNRAAADQYLARLRQVAPGDPRIARADLTVRGATLDPAGLEEARRLGQTGNSGGAIQRYRELFRGAEPPPNVAVEYYQTLAGTEAGYAEAQRGLARLAAENPNDRRIQLAYAQVLSFRDGTRSLGLERLRALALTPDAGQAATAAWRNALLWSGPNPALVPQFRAFLERNPNDREMQDRLAQALNPPVGPRDVQGDARSQGFEALNRNRLADAERQFQEALSLNPQDSDALGGLGVIRLRQGRQAEARTLLQQAIANDPQDGRRKWGPALAGSNFTGEVNQVRGLMLRGDLDQAEQQLLRIVRRDTGERADAEAMLGDIALRRGDPVAAEQRYRAALARRPELPTALSGLYDALQQLGRFAEAEDLLQRRGGGGLLAAAGTQRAEALRAEASRTADPEAALALLRAAVAANPGDPWIRLDAARLLARQGRGAEGRALVEEPLSVGRPSNEAIYAAALYASEEERLGDAARLVEMIPDRLRTADQTRLLRRARVQQQVVAAAAPASVGDRASARMRLLSLAANPDPTGEMPAAVVRALVALNDRQGAMEAARVAASVNRGAPPAGRLLVADAMLTSGLTYEAAVLAQALQQDQRLTADERRRVASLMTGIAIRESDRLNDQGNQAAAYQQLGPALMQDPANPAANLALARLYQGASEPRDAQRIAEAVLQRDPRNTDARQTAMDAAIALRDWRRAEALLTEGRALLPNDPRISMLEARLARANGDVRRAQRALEQAAVQRRDQLGMNQPIGSFAPSAQGEAPAPQPGGFDNPFRRTPLAGTDGPAPQVWSARPEAAGQYAPTQYAPTQYAQIPYTQTQVPFAEPQFRQPPLSQPPAMQAPPPQPQFFQPQTFQQQPYVVPPQAAPAAQPRFARPPAAPQPQFVQAPNPQAQPAPRFQPVTPQPFRPSPVLGQQNPVTADPLLTDISRQLTEVREEAAPRASLAAGIRARSGDPGLDKLNEINGTLEGSTAMPGVGGRLVARVTPIGLDSGTLGTDVPTLRRYGTNVLSLPGGTNPAISASQAQGVIPRTSTASGVGLGLAYVRDGFSADIGTTPLGFPLESVVGGVQFAPSLSQGVRLRLTGERRAVTDSLLSFAGVRDTPSSQTWGGVIRNTGRAAIEGTAGDTELYVLGGYSNFTGTNVADNNSLEAGAGFRTPIFRTATDELVTGVDLTYLAYDNNLRFFTYGQGGYFSPQSYYAATIPLDYRARSGNLFYRIGGTVGYNTFRESASPLFPTSSTLQGQVNTRAAADPAIAAYYPSQTQSGFAGGLRGDVEYAVTPTLRLGGLARFDRAGDWNEARAMLFARYRFGN